MSSYIVLNITKRRRNRDCEFWSLLWNSWYEARRSHLCARDLGLCCTSAAMKAFMATTILVLATAVLLATGKKFRWCTLSDQEQRKCAELSKTLLTALPRTMINSFARVSCIRAHNTHDCIDKIRANKADAASLDAGDAYSAVKLYGLTVVAKEIYLEGNCVYAVAVARRGTLDIHRLKGTRSCHNGARWTSGWNIPLGFLLARNELLWDEEQPLSHVIGDYFNASCIPGIGVTSPQLCTLCQGQKSYIWEKNHFCETSSNEPFYDSEGAFRCLKSAGADVAFLDHLVIKNATESEQGEYVLLCPDGSTAPLSTYADCNLGRGPGRTVVTRHNFHKITRKFLTVIQHLFGRKGREKARFELFASSPFRGKNLLFRDATQHLQLVEEETDISRVLGLDYVALLQGLGHEGSSLSNSLVRWCCISDAELQKCEEWALNIKSDPLVCIQADSMINCIELIKNNKADAVTLDATHAYFAQKCALVPVAAECYGPECIPARKEERMETLAHLTALPQLFSVALAKKNAKHINIHNLGGRRSCHSHMYSPGGWLLLSQYTVGALENDTIPCNLSSAYQDYFWKSCMPGADGNLCKVCIGQTETEAGKGLSRCAANHNEQYYGNTGALRCLFGDPSGRSFGDVAFLEHHNLLHNIEYLERSGWVTGGGASDLELLCLDGSRAAVTDWRACNLGPVPPNVVVTRPVTITKVYDFLAKSQKPSLGTTFQLFQSQNYGESDLLFKDATQHLVPTSHLDYEEILGESFFQLAESVFNCTPVGKLSLWEDHRWQAIELPSQKRWIPSSVVALYFCPM
ncbi:melanotransferrin-like isoform X2 [Hemicordylus capensis]|uniref:melanotransferrin-like isoform X2 n=1 Tax=Hemicordylus capensis TaxID=884348 RepID=UPI00230239DC|nr:melanotransferrin-like isoform X2 [Hemicordylus capensis]